MPAVSHDETATLDVPTGFDPDLRHDLTSAAWLIGAVTLPGLALLALLPG